MDSSLWRQHYHPDMKHEIDPNEYTSLVDYFEQHAEKHSSNIAFECMGQGLSYAETRHYARRFAGWLQSKNLDIGARVAIMLPNCLPYPVTMFGTLYANATVTNLNPLFTPEELHQQLICSGAKVLVVLENFAHAAEQAIANNDTAVEHIVIAKMSDFHSAPKSWLINSSLKYVRRQIPKYHLPNAIFLSKALQQNHSYHHVDINHDTLAYLQYTGGTTGKAKGAMLSHGNIIANVLQTGQYVQFISPPNGEPHRVLTALPLYHILSLVASMWMFIPFGSRNVLVPNPRDLDTMVKTFKKVKPTYMASVNTLLNLLLTSEEFKKLDFSSLSATIAGGMPVQADTAKKWEEVTGCAVCQGYGLTEASPVVSVNIPVDLKYNGSIGYIAPSTEAKLVDEDGFEVKIGEPGELWVSGPQVMQGYWENEIATNDVITKDGWLRTGDIGLFDESGLLKIVDRKKHLIIVSGFNVYPAEVEDTLTQHEEIEACAVVGIPSRKTGESVRAYITLAPGAQLSSEEIKIFARHRLTAYKVPTDYVFRENLPMTNVGKVDVKALKIEVTQEFKTSENNSL